MKIIWLGHSGFRFDGEGYRLLVDPFLRNSPVFDEAHFETAINGTTHIALTHGHWDHLGDTIEIIEKTGCKLICNEDLGRWLIKRGVTNVELGNIGGTLVEDKFSVTFVDAKHSAALIEHDGVLHATGSANGLMFHFNDGQSVLHMGDTDIFSDMSLINELHKPKIGIVPIGDRYTMGPAVAALACRRFFNFETVLPSHYGSIERLQSSAAEFKQAMEDKSHIVHTPSIGEVITV